MKKIIAILMTVTLLVGIFATYSVSAAEESAEIAPDYSWYDAEETEFIITTEAQLLGLGYITALVPGTDFEGKTIKLGDNIVLNEGNAADWETNPPANILTALPVFRGTFDGQGYSISGAYGDGSARTLGLLFGEISGNACVKNLAIINSYFVTASSCGGIAGRVTNATEVRFENVYVDILMVGDAWEAGGFVGSDYSANQKVVFENCVSAVTFKLIPDGAAYIGGFIGYAGYATNGTMEFNNCLNVGTIHAQKRVGGIAGLANNVTFNKCVNLGKITGVTGGKLVAGIVGEGKKVDIVDCYIATDVMTTPLKDDTGNSAAGCLGTDATCSYVEFNSEMLKGDGATLMNKLDWEETWTTQEDELPTLKFVPVFLATAAEGPTDEGGNGENNGENNNENNNENNGENNNENNNENNTNTNTTPDTSANTDANTDATSETEAAKGGCGGSIGIAGVAMIALASGAALVIKKKED